MHKLFKGPRPCRSARGSGQARVSALLLALALTALPLRSQDLQKMHTLDPLSDTQLKALVLQCNRTAQQQLLGMGEAVACSIGWEALKARVFAGDFQALMRWWQEERDRVDVAQP